MTRPLELDPFYHPAGLPPYSAGHVRWPLIVPGRATTPEALARWRPLLGPFRTRRAAYRAARQHRDASGPIRRAWYPGATILGVIRRGKTWHVWERPARGKRDSFDPPPQRDANATRADPWGLERSA